MRHVLQHISPNTNLKPKCCRSTSHDIRFFPPDIFSQIWQHWQHRCHSTFAPDSKYGHILKLFVILHVYPQSLTT